jgi:hypothetical protein
VNAPVPWTPEQLRRIDAARELEISTTRTDGTLRPWLPIWVVCVGEQVYVRTWYRRTTGWFGHAIATRQARVRVPGLEADVIVADVGERDSDLRSAVDEAYAAKYAPHGGGSVGQMTSDSAASTTLRLVLPTPPARHR